MMRCPNHLEKYRVAVGGDEGDACNGFLMIKSRGLAVQFSDGGGWEHVSVSRKSKVPSYDDLCWIKDQFWNNRDTVMQLHVPKKDHVNVHPWCLHLWRPLDQEIPRPPGIMVG